MNWYKKSEEKNRDWMGEEYDHAIHNVLSEFLANPKGKQPWSVVPAARLNKIWKDFAKYNVVHDEAGLEEIAEHMIKNVFRLQVNTELAGHTPLDPKEIYEMEGVKFTKKKDEMFSDYILDDGQWRISDYGLNPLMNDAIKLKEASNSTEKLLIIDHMLNIVHRRSNLPAMFVEGGGTTLDDLYENPEEKTYIEEQISKQKEDSKQKEEKRKEEKDPRQMELKLSRNLNWYKKAQEQSNPTEVFLSKFKPSSLRGLAAEALKCQTFDDFEDDYIGQIKHGTYWHITDDPNFKIDPLKGPRDMSSMNPSSSPSKGKLMITSDLTNWLPRYPNRKYVAEIDMSNVDKKDYFQVGRGFGNEFIVTNPSKAKVLRVLTVQEALRFNRYRHNKMPQSQDSLRDFYNNIKKQYDNFVMSMETDELV